MSTLVVSASLPVCSGAPTVPPSQVYSSITAAVAAIVASPSPSLGYTIYICVGTYSEIIVVPATVNNLTFITQNTGIDALTRFNDPSSAEVIIDGSDQAFSLFTFNGNNISMDGFTFRNTSEFAAGISLNGSDYKIANNIFEYFGSGLSFNETSGISVVQGNVFDITEGVTISGSDNITIQNNTFLNSSILVGAAIAPPAIPLSPDIPSTNITITDNTIQGSIFIAGGYEAVTTNTLIKNNIITLASITTSGISFLGATSTTTIESNCIISNKYSGISIINVGLDNTNSGITIQNNNIYCNGGTTSAMLGLVISGVNAYDPASLIIKGNYWGPLSTPPGMPVSPNNTIFPATIVDSAYSSTPIGSAPCPLSSCDYENCQEEVKTSQAQIVAQQAQITSLQQTIVTLQAQIVALQKALSRCGSIGGGGVSASVSTSSGEMFVYGRKQRHPPIINKSKHTTHRRLHYTRKSIIKM